MLCALRNQVAPYENEKGAADRMVDLWVERLGRVLSRNFCRSLLPSGLYLT